MLKPTDREFARAVELSSIRHAKNCASRAIGSDLRIQSVVITGTKKIQYSTTR